MSDHAVRTVELRRDFGSVRAVDGLCLEIPKGSICLLLGSNGAGKTTLLRILMGLIQPTAGAAYVLGAATWPPPSEVLSSLGYVGDRCEPPAWVSLALLEDLQAGASPSFDKTLFRDLCRQRDLPPDRPYGSLSKGQRRWTLVSLALASRPQLILLDEPADGLDPSARRALYDALRDHVNRNGATAIVTTHVIADVERIGDEVAIIDRGRLLIHAPLEELRENVRQVEIPIDGPPPELGESAAILGRAQFGATAVVWIKQDGISDDTLRGLGPEIAIRHVGLETLYEAIVEHRPGVKMSLEQEVGS
jgi:ABC-2 type transport system ATP-binding protein